MWVVEAEPGIVEDYHGFPSILQCLWVLEWDEAKYGDKNFEVGSSVPPGGLWWGLIYLIFLDWG